MCVCVYVCMYCMYVCILADAVPELQSEAMRGVSTEDMVRLIQEESTAWYTQLTYIHTNIHVYTLYIYKNIL